MSKDDTIDREEPNRRISVTEWNRRVLKWHMEWKEFRAKHRGKFFCVHSWAELPEEKYPVTRLYSKVRRAYGCEAIMLTAFSELRYFYKTPTGVAVCVKCGKWKFWDAYYQLDIGSTLVEEEEE